MLLACIMWVVPFFNPEGVNLSQQQTSPKAPRQQQQHRGIEGLLGRNLPGTILPGTLPQRPRPAVRAISSRGVPVNVPHPNDGH